ncbi:MAG: hypothetical protein ABSA44_11515 [Bacteroidota bacterium]|jgi:hypothetical protein
MKDIELIIQDIVRCISVSGVIIGLAYLIYGSSVFIPTRWPFQYLISGITIGIAFATFRDKNYREGIALLALWYIILFGSVTGRHSWMFILEGTYIIIISIAVFFCITIVRKPFINNEFLRVCTSTVILGIANSFIVVLLNLFSLTHIYPHLSQIFDAMFLNLKIGAMLGLFMGVGVELSDGIINPILFKKKVAS